MPQVLRQHRIPFHCIRQKKGQYVIIFFGAYHIVMNAGQNYAEAINFCMPEWERALVPPDECSCTENGYPAVRKLFNIKGLQGIVGKGASGKQWSNFPRGLRDELNAGKCSGLSIALALSKDILLLFFAFRWMTWLPFWWMTASHLQRLGTLPPARTTNLAEC
jgi:hypothetical protein